MSLPKWATTVTPLSKTIALILFILLPFVGFLLGMNYQKSITPIYSPSELQTGSSQGPNDSGIPSKGTNLTSTIDFTNMNIQVPTGYVVEKRTSDPTSWGPNSGCFNTDSIGILSTTQCNTLLIHSDQATEHYNQTQQIVLSSPAQFWAPNIQNECTNNVNSVISVGKRQIPIVVSYYNHDEVTYTPENIDKNISPYTCDKVSRTPGNYVHLAGCADNLCVWGGDGLTYQQITGILKDVEIN